MFAQLGVWLSTFLTGYVSSVVATLAAALTPVALIWLTVYIANYGYAVARGEASDPFSVFAWKMVKMMFIMAIALSAARFMDIAFSTADGLQDGMATIFLRGGQFGGSAPATVFGSLDAANDQANSLLVALWGDAGITRLDLVLASVLFALGTVIFLVLGAFVALLSKVILAFTMAIGPIAVLCLMFRVTAKFFDAWLSTVMSAVVLAWFVFFALGLSFFVAQELLRTMDASHAFAADGTVAALKAAATYLVFMLLLAILLYQSPHLASALTGGASIRTGGAVAAGYAMSRMISGRNSGGSGASGGGAGAGGSSIARGAGPAYAAGRAAAAMGQAGATVGVAGLAAANTGVAAYQRVARRGNRA
ncbi:MAG: type IV secretion system protein [Caldimonas sp.]